MIDWPKELIASIARRRSVLFLGAGISQNSRSADGQRPPSWQSALQLGIDKCTGSTKEMRGMLKKGDFLGCCQILKNRMGVEWVPFLEEVFRHPNFQPAEIHTAILKLDSAIVATPNFDKIYDDYAVNKTNGFLKIKKFFDDDIPRALRGNEDQRLILKVHGCIDTPDKLIFTREEYADARHRNAAFYRALDALFLTNTFVFLGCSMNDPDLNLVLEQYTRSFSFSPPHYVLLSGRISEDYRDLLLRNYNLKVVTYSAANEHAELLDSLKGLEVLVNEKRDELANTRLW
ncbi:SIR2 family NAD-dependent protein deacylase [Martelella sp. FOR1707]